MGAKHTKFYNKVYFGSNYYDKYDEEDGYAKLEEYSKEKYLIWVQYDVNKKDHSESEYYDKVLPDEMRKFASMIENIEAKYGGSAEIMYQFDEKTYKVPYSKIYEIFSFICYERIILVREYDNTLRMITDVDNHVVVVVDSLFWFTEKKFKLIKQKFIEVNSVLVPRSNVKRTVKPTLEKGFLEELTKLFQETSFSKEDQDQYVDGIIGHGCNSMDLVRKLKVEDLQEIGITAKLHQREIMDHVVNYEPRFTAFISYARMDTTAEASIIYNNLTEKLGPKQPIFRDADESFHLDQLLKKVQRAKNVVVLLSPNYVRRPYTLVELCSTLKFGANIICVQVIRPNLERFNFEKITNDIKSGDFKKYLDDDGWDILQRNDFSYQDVCDAILKVFNVKAWEYNPSDSLKIQQIRLEEIFEQVKI